jgi:hypothetical protein
MDCAGVTADALSEKEKKTDLQEEITSSTKSMPQG